MSKTETLNLSKEEIAKLEKAIDDNQLDANQKILLKCVLATLEKVCMTLEEKKASLFKLRKLFGLKTEKIPKTSKDLEVSKSDDGSIEGNDKGKSGNDSSDQKKRQIKIKRRGSLAISGLIQNRH